MKRIIAAAAAGLFILGCSMTVSAAGLEDFNDYRNEDGTYSYYFEQGLKVTLSEEWYQNTLVKATDREAVFYHRGSYEKYEEEGLKDCGKLFSIGYSVNSDFKKLDEVTYIGFDEENMLNYYAVKPTDYPAYTGDPEIREEYDTLMKETDEVIGNVEIVSAVSGETTVTSSREVSDEELYAAAENDLFSFEYVKDWVVQDYDGTMYVSKDGSDREPFYLINRLDSEQTPGEMVVQWKNDYLDTYQERVVKQPEVIPYEVPGTDRKLAGFTAAASSLDGSRTITMLEFVEVINEVPYHYYCSYVSQSYVEGEYEDETTYFEFLHAIDTMEIK